MPRRKTSFRFNGLAIGDMVRVKGNQAVGEVTGFKVSLGMRMAAVWYRFDGLVFSKHIEARHLERIDGRSKQAREARG